jgi:hypothetical protein
MEEENSKKKNILIIVLVVLLVFILIAFISFVFFIKNTSSDTTKIDEDETTTIQNTMDEDEALKLLTKFDITDLTVTDYSDEVRFGATINNLSGTYTKYDCSDLLSDELNNWETRDDGYLIAGTSSSRPYFCSNSQKYELYPYNDVNSMFKTMFNGSVINGKYGSYYYISKYNGYSYLLYADGTTGPNVSIDKIKDVNVSDTKLIITAYLENIEAYDEKNFKVGDNLIPFDMDDDNYVNTVKDKIINNYLDSVNTYKISFTIDNDNYVFESINKIN